MTARGIRNKLEDSLEKSKLFSIRVRDDYAQRSLKG